MKLAPLFVVAALLSTLSPAAARTPYAPAVMTEEQGSLEEERYFVQAEAEKRVTEIERREQEAPAVLRARVLAHRASCVAVGHLLSTDLARFAWDSGRRTLEAQHRLARRARAEQIDTLRVDLQERLIVLAERAALAGANRPSRMCGTSRMECGTRERPLKRSKIAVILGMVLLGGLAAGLGVMTITRKLA